MKKPSKKMESSKKDKMMDSKQMKGGKPKGKQLMPPKMPGGKNKAGTMGY